MRIAKAVSVKAARAERHTVRNQRRFVWTGIGYMCSDDGVVLCRKTDSVGIGRQ